MDIYDFTVTTYRILTRNGINSMAELVKLKRADLMKMRGMGWRSLHEIEEKVAKFSPRPEPKEVQVLGQISIFDLEGFK